MRDFLQRANLTPEQFARRLSRLAAEQGLARRVDDKTPYKWCRGSIPRPPWPALAACELSRRLGTHVTVEDLGWSNGSTVGQRFLAADADLDLPWTVQGALTGIGRVSDQDVSMDRLFLPVPGTALTKLALDWLTADPADDPVRAEGRGVGMEQAEDLEYVTARLRRIDGRHGGGVALPLATAHATYVTGILRDYSYSADVGTRLYAGAAELHSLLGWLCFDAGRPTQAHRHWFVGLRAAHAAADPAVGASILAAMSVQASAAGQSGPAIHLASAARRGHLGAGPRLAAVVSLAAAQAHASAGEAAACHGAIDAAREALAAANPDAPEPGGITWLDDAAASAEVGTAYLYLSEYKRAQGCLKAALRQLDPVARARNIAVTHARLALAYVGRGDPERACQSAGEAISILTRTVDSGRCIGYLRQLFEALRPYRRNPAVAALASQAEMLLSRLPDAYGSPRIPGSANGVIRRRTRRESPARAMWGCRWGLRVMGED